MRRLLLISTLLLASAFGHVQTLTVFSASSLTEAFSEMAAAFERRHPGAAVRLSFAGSSTLAFQIRQGAPANVFASADTAQMQLVEDAGLIKGDPAVFALNRLVVITPADSAVRGLEDLAEPGVGIVVAGPQVPVGAYSRDVIDNLNAVYGDAYAMRVLDNVVSEEPNVRQVAAKVELGEADAALVYATGAAVLSGVRTLEIPESANVTAAYSIAVVCRGDHRRLARDFVDFVLSREGRRILSRHGFALPDR